MSGQACEGRRRERPVSKCQRWALRSALCVYLPLYYNERGGRTEGFSMGAMECVCGGEIIKSNGRV